MLPSDMAAKIPKFEEKPAHNSRSIYVSDEDWTRLRAIATELGQTRSKLVAGILRDWVKDYDSPDPKKAKKN